MQQMALIPEVEQSQKATTRPGPDALRDRLSAVAPEPAPVVTEDEECEDPATILRALVADLEEAIEIGRQMDADLMTMMRRIVPAEESTT